MLAERTMSLERAKPEESTKILERIMVGSDFDFDYAIGQFIPIEKIVVVPVRGSDFDFDYAIGQFIPIEKIVVVPVRGRERYSDYILPWKATVPESTILQERAKLEESTN